MRKLTVERNFLEDNCGVEHEIRHGIQFGDFDSRCFRLFLHERIAPTPKEKEVKVSIPYRQGLIDLSGIMGQRVYENREITYIFYRFGVAMDDAGVIQSAIENLLMREIETELYDSYEPAFYYRGKCREIFVDDDYPHNRLRIEMTFDLHPFKFRHELESELREAEVFDQFIFDIDTFQHSYTQDALVVDHSAGQSQQVVIHNNSKRNVRPIINSIAQRIVSSTFAGAP